MKTNHLSQVITNAVSYLLATQAKDGSFTTYSSPNENDFTQAFPENTTFLNAFMLLLLSSLSPTKEINSSEKKLAAYLLAQKSDYWSWNYWVKNSPAAKHSPYPDDLDDTFCTLTALYKYDKKIITGKVFAYLVKILTQTEKKEGGPYRTWIVKKNAASHWKDVDFAVNSNIAYFLFLTNITLPNMTKFFENKLRRREVLSPYYPSSHAPLFFLSRFYNGKQKKVIEEMSIQRRGKHGVWENPLKTALSVLTLLTIDYPIEKLEESITYLLQTQENGRWKAYGFCIDPTIKGEKHFAGSPALTTAFCLTALQHYEAVKNTNKLSESFIKSEKEKRIIKKRIIQKIEKCFSKQTNVFNNKGKILLGKIYTRDVSEQIPLLPYYFMQSLAPQKRDVSKKIIVQLGMANILGWLAYTIYDDFFDDEGDPQLLSLANFCLRNVTEIFDSFATHTPEIQKNFHILLNLIDQANAWEVTQCRMSIEIPRKNWIIPDYGNLTQLAHKSIGHALGPLTILLLLGYTRNSREFKNISVFFVHYLIAKQLNDDAHDFLTDLKKGRITPVVALVLKRAKEKKILMQDKKLQEIFWQEVIVEVCDLIFLHVEKANRALKKSRSISQPDILQSLLSAFKKGADQALEERNKVMEFLTTYEV